MGKFFTFSQDNSGGRFDVRDKDGIAEAVIIACVDRASAKDGYRNTAYVHPKVGAFYLVETK